MALALRPVRNLSFFLSFSQEWPQMALKNTYLVPAAP